MKDQITECEIKLTVTQAKTTLKNYYGMYVHYMTIKSSNEMFDYQQWSKTTVVTSDFINNLSSIKGLIKLSVWFEYPLFECDITDRPKNN